MEMWVYFVVLIAVIPKVVNIDTEPVGGYANGKNRGSREFFEGKIYRVNFS